MGFFDKVKAIKNTLTGGGAKVFLESSPINGTEPFEVTIRAEVSDADLKIDRVYLEVRGYEEIQLEDYDFVYDADGEQRTRREHIERESVTIDLEITVDGEQELQANESYEWTTQVELPDEAMPFYTGHNCRHFYAARASLDAFGNDPDSGWVELAES